MKNTPSYHDVFITTRDIERKSIFDLPYGFFIQCSRTRGWSLWRNDYTTKGKEDCLIAEEYCGEESGKWLVIDVAGHVILDSRASEAVT